MVEQNLKGVFKNSIESFISASAGIGLMLLQSEEKSIMDVLHFVDSSIRGLIHALPDSDPALKIEIGRRRIEVVLSQLLLNECRSSFVTCLFDEICHGGFSSEAQAVACAVEYCGWLKANGHSKEIKRALVQIGKQVQHPKMVDQMQQLAKRLGVQDYRWKRSRRTPEA